MYRLDITTVRAHTGLLVVITTALEVAAHQEVMARVADVALFVVLCVMVHLVVIITAQAATVLLVVVITALAHSVDVVITTVQAALAHWVDVVIITIVQAVTDLPVEVVVNSICNS